jgi:hypothetical protein
LLASTAAALVFVLIGLVLWQRSASLSRELYDLNAQSAELSADFKQQQYDVAIAKLAALETWQATDVNWLDELDRLSLKWRPEPLEAKKFPVADDAVVTQIVAFRPPGNQSRGGRVVVQAVARNQAALATLEGRLRDAEHRVATGSGKQDSSVPGYGWSFGLMMDVPATDESAEAAP